MEKLLTKNSQHLFIEKFSWNCGQDKGIDQKLEIYTHNEREISIGFCSYRRRIDRCVVADTIIRLYQGSK